MSRNSGRKDDEKRQVEIITGFNPFAEGSCLIKCGNTHVVCTATVEDKVPSWLKGQEKGWVTAEYAMLPRATLTRVPRETKKPSGRSQEIQRLVGRALRAGVDLEKMPEISVTIDCDVLQADGGTRTASITGGFVALYQALQKMVAAEKLPEKHFIFHDGFCHVHKSIHAAELQAAKDACPDALVLTHPECTEDVVAMSDFVGSTSEIIDFATQSDCKKFIICTEMGVFFELQQKNPGKKFYSVGHRQFCPNMKKVTIDKVEQVLEKLGSGELEEITLSDEILTRAAKPLQRMLELAK